MSSIEIRQHPPGGDVEPFIAAGRAILGGDPVWVPPLDLEMRARLSPTKNPLFKRAEVMLFTAWKDGDLVGRCSATVDREHLRVHNDDAGFFGFFDTIDDVEVGRALLDAAEGWLAERGMKVMRGPLSLYMNDEAGILVEGFDEPPAILMAHSRPWQAAVVEAAGLTKAKDLLAWRWDVGQQPPARCVRAWEAVREMPEVRFRDFDPSQMKRELDIFMEIYNDAWGKNWGFVPALDDEVAKVAKDLRPIIDPRIAFFAEVDGQPMGLCISVPNINEAMRDLDGKLFPFGIFKLIWRTKVKRPKSARLIFLGIRKELRHVKRYGGLSMAMYVELAKRGEKLGYKWAELSWTLEDNTPVNLGIRAMGGRLYKKYRLYERRIGAASSRSPSESPSEARSVESGAAAAAPAATSTP